MRTRGTATCAILTGLALAAAVYGQGLTGQIAGTVSDPGGAMVANAKALLTNTETTQNREILTDPDGNFLFADLLPGTYRLAVEAAGFKRYEEADIQVSANERVTLRPFVLQIGQVNEILSVTAEAARLQTQSSERSGLIDTRQMQDLSLKGRDYLGMMSAAAGRHRFGQPRCPWLHHLRIGQRRPDRHERERQQGALPQRHAGRHLRARNRQPDRTVDLAEPGSHRRDESAAHQLPGRVRAQFGRHHQHRDQERHEGFSRQRVLFLPRRLDERQQLLQQPPGPAARSVSLQ